MKDGLLIKKPISVHSKARARLAKEAKSKGRHTGYGKRRGTREARLQVELDAGIFKEAVPEDEISAETCDVGDLFDGF